MPYEIFQRKTTRLTSPAVSLTTAGRLALNATAARLFQKNAVEFVLLLWDKEQRKVGIRPIGKRDQRSFKVTYSKKHDGAGISAKSFLDHIGWNMNKRQVFQAFWSEQDGILEFGLSSKKGEKEARPTGR